MCKVVICLAAAAGLAASFVVSIGTATADPYKWCAVYGSFGATNCGFITIEQCRATVYGAGGSCVPNQFYIGPDRRPVKRARKPT